MTGRVADLGKLRPALVRARLLLRPVPRTTPTAWARKSRNYPSTVDKPGPREPSYTPYVVAFEDAIEGVSHAALCLVCGSQMGKTDAVLDMIGWRLDTRPRPQLYVGPSKEFLTDQLEPRIMALLDQAPTLRDKVARGKRMKKTRKLVAGVPLRLAWAGSPTQLSSDQAGDIYVDELDRMATNVGDEGDPLTIVRARGFTYRDRRVVVTSTPKRGSVEVEKDPLSGLEFWRPAEPEDVESPIWKLWQSGTRHHWSWPCPHCGTYFIPRFACLEWPKVEVVTADGEVKERRPTALEARSSAFVRCPTCQEPIPDECKAEMNARGVYVAPGQQVDLEGEVFGDAPQALTASYWVSGLASPFVSFGERAAEYIEALESGDHEKLQAVINTGFGELWAPAGGEAPPWEEVARLRLPYSSRDIPEGVLALTAGVDVQKDRLVYVIRGWGVRQESWLIEHGELWSETAGDDVWVDLAELLGSAFGRLHIRRAFVDSGFRPGKASAGDEHKVYEFCRRHARTCYATKGFDRRDVPLSVKRVDVTSTGKTAKYGLDLVRLDSDFFKSWVHQRLRWPVDQPGGWHLPQDATDDYCRQIVSEGRARRASGGHVWVQRSRENHYLDAEALAYAAAYMLGVQRLTPDHQAPRPTAAGPSATPAAPVSESHAEARLQGRRSVIRSNFMRPGTPR